MSGAGLDLLVVGAHPDDAEVHLGGLLALASLRGLKAGILDLTCGDRGTQGTPAQRREEAARAAEILGVERRILDFPDALFDEGHENLKVLVEALRELRPEVLLLQGPEDTHPDHRRGHRLCQEAAFYAGLRNYPAPGEPWRPQAVAWAGSASHPDTPDLLVDVSSVWERRMRALDTFGSQLEPEAGRTPTRISHPSFRRGVEGRAMHWGASIQVDHAEGLYCAKPVPQALLRLLARLQGWGKA